MRGTRCRLAMSIPQGRRKKPRLNAAELDAAVLAILRAAELPLTAYAVQDRAAVAGLQLYPTQIYRVMRRLMDQGEVGRVESANAYSIQRGEPGSLLICQACEKVSTVVVNRAAGDIIDAALAAGFEIDRLILEAVGRCASCRN